ncbi:glycosyltransferase family 2 protein [Petrachloros mirabilis]
MVSAVPPFFSILIPSYNRPESIVECIDSILANEGEDYELIISDDASPKAEAIDSAVRPYLDRPNVCFHRQPQNIGEPANRNFLVARATGRYNIILCDDDKLFPRALRTIREHIEATPGQDLYLFGYQVIDSSGRPCYDRVAPGPLAISLEQSQLIRHMFEGTWLPFLICHPSTFCCKRGVETETPYRQDVSTADDYMFLLECLNRGKRLYVLPECVMQYRWIPSADGMRQTNQSSDNVKVLQAFTKMYYAFQGRTDLHPFVAGVIQGQDYRKRFLYDLVVRRMSSYEYGSVLSALQPAHREELAAFAAQHSRPMMLLKTAVLVANQLAQCYGVKGLVYSMRVGVAYLQYKVFPGSLLST